MPAAIHTYAFAVLTQGGQAQSGAPGGTPIDATVKAALITACVTLLGIILKDLVLKFIEERRATSRAEAAVYSRYSKPLAAAASSLLVRLDEIILQRHRPVYLKIAGIPAGKGAGSAFRAYKKLSTLYRLASLIGWVRACRREFSHVRVAPRNENAAIDSAISELENALADGSWIERERVLRLVDLWKLCAAPDITPTKLAEFGILVDNAIWDVLESAQLQEFSELSQDQQESACRTVAKVMTSYLQTNAVDPAVMSVTWPDAFRIISIREAWLYKDWQDALGDMMLRRVEAEDRKFEVLGYSDFERLYRAGDEAQKERVNQITEIFDALDLSIEDRFDARPRQLRRLSRATAKLVKALNAAQGDQSILSSHVLRVADKVLNTVPEK
jgi:hypothetical protein